MIASLSLIPLCQLAGEAFVRGYGLPTPRPVVGRLLLLVPLLLRDQFKVLARGPLQCEGVENVSDAVAGVFAGIARSLNALVTPFARGNSHARLAAVFAMTGCSSC